MADTRQPDDRAENQMEIVRLLDERYRLREDPDRRNDLERIHARLRDRLEESKRVRPGG
jgi:hypothetical protein